MVLGTDTSLALGVAAIAAAAGVLGAGITAVVAIVTNRSTMRFDREQRLEERQLGAAVDFIQGFTRAMATLATNLGEEVGARDEDSGAKEEDSGASEDGLPPLANAAAVLEVGANLTAIVWRIRILFGSNSEPAITARNANYALRDIVQGKRDAADLGESGLFLEEFIDAVSMVVGDPRPPSLGHDPRQQRLVPRSMYWPWT